MTAWIAHAACRHPEVDPEAFFPHPGRTFVEAAAWCAQCPVTAECLQVAVSDPHTVGVWGGRLFGGRASRAKAVVS